MTRFLWKIAGGDCDLLDRSGRDSQYSFYIIGLLYIIINVLIFTAFLGLFVGVFHNLFAALLGSLAIGFLISNIYRLTMISLEPQVLPVKEEPGSVVVANVIRYATVLAFAFFVSKCLEMVLINFMETIELVNYDGSLGYMNHMTQSNKENPWLWLLTAGIAVLFATPIFLRLRLKGRTAEYYSLKKRRDIRIVKEEYNRMIKVRDGVFRDHYQGYTPLGFSAKYKSAPLKFEDPPFNTKPIVLRINLKSSAELMEKLYGKAR